MDPVNFHYVASYISVLLVPLSLALLLFGIVQSNRNVVRAGLVGCVLAGVLAVGVFRSGKSAEGGMGPVAQASSATIEQHKSIALFGLAGACASAAAAGIALIWMQLRDTPPRWLLPAVAAIALGATLMLLWTAMIGKQISHSEVMHAASQIHDD